MALSLALAGLGAAPADAYSGCAPDRYCPPWRADCGRYDCLDRRDCDYGRTCYYGPADPPPRHPWRAEEPWAPEKHAWREFPEEQRPAPPPPARRPDPPSEQRQTAEVEAEPERPEQPEPDETAAVEAETEMRPRRQAGIPERYQRAENSVGHTLIAIQSGASLYRENCASCHGAAGEGDGPRAQTVNTPMPALPYTLEQSYSTDAYLLWTIMEGGTPVGTEKPAFRDKLTTEQAWQIIAYMRAGFPARSPAQPLRQTMQTQTGNTPAPAR